MMNSLQKNAFRFAIATILATSVVLSVAAQDDFPTKPVVVTVPFSPGGGNDILLRLVAKHANPFLGQNLVVENKPGAGGQIGWTALAKARPDGYNIGASSLPSMVLIKALRPTTPYAMDDFTYICNIQVDPIVWVVRSDSSIASAADFVAQAKNPKKKINVAGDGPQSNVQLQHLAAAKALGLETNFVSFSGSGPAITALLGDQVDIAASTLSAAMPNIEAGKLRALVVFADQPSRLLPDVPTATAALGEAIPSVGMAVRGLVAPKSVPEDRVAKLDSVCKQIAESPAFTAEASDLGIDVQFMDANASEALVKSSIEQIESLKDLLK